MVAVTVPCTVVVVVVVVVGSCGSDCAAVVVEVNACGRLTIVFQSSSVWFCSFRCSV